MSRFAQNASRRRRVQNEQVFEGLMLAYLAARDIENVQQSYLRMRTHGLRPTLLGGEVLLRALLLRDDTLPAAFDLVDHLAVVNNGHLSRRVLQDVIASCARLPRARGLPTMLRLLRSYEHLLCEETLSLAINVARSFNESQLETEVDLIVACLLHLQFYFSEEFITAVVATKAIIVDQRRRASRRERERRRAEDTRCARPASSRERSSIDENLTK